MLIEFWGLPYPSEYICKYNQVFFLVIIKQSVIILWKTNKIKIFEYDNEK